MHHYTECDLPGVWLVNGYHKVDTPYGKAVSVEDVDGLHKLIGVQIAERKSPLTREEFRFLRKELGLSQAAFGKLIGTAEQNVSNWERGKVEIPPPSERTIRLLYMEKVKRSVKFMQMLKVLSAMDEARSATKLEFEKDDDSWHPKAA